MMLAFESVKVWANTHIDEMISKIDFSSVDINDYLNSRDLPPFDQDWLSAYEEIVKIKQTLSQLDISKLDALSEKIRQKVFELTFRYSGAPELAGYISDDVGLFIEAMVLKVSNKWINGLFQCYLDCALPSSRIRLVDQMPVKI